MNARKIAQVAVKKGAIQKVSELSPPAISRPERWSPGITVILLNNGSKEVGQTKKDDLLNRITVKPDVIVGKPIIRGLRITVEQKLKSFAGGITVEQLLKDYPELEKEDMHAVLLYTSELVNEEQVPCISGGR